MTRALINAHCATLPGAEVSDPWGGGHDAWKVGGKMFAVVGVMEDGVSVKCADVETAGLLIEMGRAVRAPYFHRSWVRVPWGAVSDDEIRERLTASYAIIRAGLPKKVQALLG
jgi:predicted DNA-binding protein (MmcQ/YjbR family)